MVPYGGVAASFGNPLSPSLEFENTPQFPAVSPDFDTFTLQVRTHGGYHTLGITMRQFLALTLQVRLTAPT